MAVWLRYRKIWSIINKWYCMRLPAARAYQSPKEILANYCLSTDAEDIRRRIKFTGTMDSCLILWLIVLHPRIVASNSYSSYVFSLINYLVSYVSPTQQNTFLARFKPSIYSGTQIPPTCVTWATQSGEDLRVWRWHSPLWALRNSKKCLKPRSGQWYFLHNMYRRPRRITETWQIDSGYTAQIQNSPQAILQQKRSQGWCLD